MPGDAVLAVEGSPVRDVIEYQLLMDSADPEVRVERGGDAATIRIEKGEGEPAGIRFEMSLFDGAKRCNNRCEFCFVNQLPKGLRDSLYEKDDDYRLSFLYGNFTTLTRFGASDLERIAEERISPLYVSMHTADPELRGRILRNTSGGESLRWLRPLLDSGIEIHGQIVLCPGINDGRELENTLRITGERWPEIASVGVVPVGVSKHYAGSDLRAASRDEMARALDIICSWQEHFLGDIGRRVVFAADEFYIGARRPFPPSVEYEGFPQYENGIGMARSLIDEAESLVADPSGSSCSAAENDRKRSVVVTGELGAEVLEKALWRELADDMAELLPVRNDFFGGNVAVAGLLSGADLIKAMSARCERDRQTRKSSHFLLPRTIVPFGQTIDGMSEGDIVGAVELRGGSAEFIDIDGSQLRAAIVRSAPSRQVQVATTGAL